MKPKVVAIITARGGSKGLPRKNILNFAGKPLLAWTIEQAIHADSIREVLVSTENGEIKSVSLQYGAKVIPRPEDLSGDDTTSDEVIAHALEWLSTNSVNVDLVVLLQPTSPLRRSSDIEAAINIHLNNNAFCVLSVYEPSISVVKAYKEQPDGTILGILSADAPYRRRQDLPRAFIPNGAVYVFSSKAFLQNMCIPRTNVYPYIMPVERSVDIDTLTDFNNAEKLLRESKDEIS